MLKHLSRVLGIAAISLTASTLHAEAPQPFEAHYQTRISGITATGIRSLEALGDGEWQLHSEARTLWMTFTESSRVLLQQQQVYPLHYLFDHPLRKNRSVDWRLDWSAHTAQEHRHGLNITLPEVMYDPLSLQLQLQLDACSDRGLSPDGYPLLDHRGSKTYQVQLMGSETLSTAVGKLETWVLEQRRPGKEQYTLLWLARDWGCLLVKMEQHDPSDREVQQLTLTSASLNGVPVRGTDAAPASGP